MTDTKPLIFKQMSNVMRDIGAVGKNQRNKDQNYDFRGIDDIFTAVHPAMVKHGVSLLYEIKSVDQEKVASRSGAAGYHTLVHVTYRFSCEDGSGVEVRTVGESVAYDDKGVNKALQAALKYALIQTFLIPVDEPEADHTTEEIAAVELASKEEIDFVLGLAKGLNEENKRLAGEFRESIGAQFTSGLTKDHFEQLVDFIEDLIGRQIAQEKEELK